MLVDRARSKGLQLTKRVLESEITDHVGYEKHDPTGRTDRYTASLPFADAPSTEPQQPDQPLIYTQIFGAYGCQSADPGELIRVVAPTSSD